MASFTEEDNKPKMSQEERDKLMEEFLSKGGKFIVPCPTFEIIGKQ